MVRQKSIFNQAINVLHFKMDMLFTGSINENTSDDDTIQYNRIVHF